MSRSLKVCYFGTYSDQEGYPMNRVLLAGLEAAGVTVYRCHVPVWADAADKMAGVGGGALLRALRLAWAWLRLAWRFFRLPDYDVLIVGYVGHLDIIAARLLGLFRPRPVVLNALISLHDTVVVDRGLVPPASLRARLLAALDRLAFRLADRILIDTNTHADYLSRRYGVPRQKWCRVLVGADPSGIPAMPPPPPAVPPVTVLYFGTYIALHGVPAIVDAARLLEGEPGIRFVMLGRGQELEAIKRRAAGLSNLTFDTRWVGREELLEAIGRAHICLGVFGAGGKSQRVIPCKVFDGLAMGRAVVTADTPAIRELLVDGESGLLVPPGDGAALAAAIRSLAADPDVLKRVAEGGLRAYRDTCRPELIGRALRDDLISVFGD